MAYVTTLDWFTWHQDYDDPDSALAAHPRRADVLARLVELDPRNAGLARAAAERAALPAVSPEPRPAEPGARMFTFTCR